MWLCCKLLTSAANPNAGGEGALRSSPPALRIIKCTTTILTELNASVMFCHTQKWRYGDAEVPFPCRGSNCGCCIEVSALLTSGYPTLSIPAALPLCLGVVRV